MNFLYDRISACWNHISKNTSSVCDGYTGADLIPLQWEQNVVSFLEDMTPASRNPKCHMRYSACLQRITFSPESSDL